MKRTLLLVSLLVAVCAIPGLLFAAESGHYVNGVEGLKAASLPPPGIYWRMYNAYYLADTIKDGSGEKLDIGFDVKVFANVNRLIYVSKYELLGGNFFADALIPLIYTDLKIDAMSLKDDKFGIGDPFVEPVGISWHGKQYDAAVGLGGYIPVGEYKDTEPASPGKDMWTAMLTAGGTVYFNEVKTWHLSMLNRYEMHSYKKELDVRPGDDFHFEWGLGTTFNQVLDVGVAGYCQWQLTDDKGDDVLPEANDRDRVFAVGPEVSYFIPKHLFFISLRGEWEFEAQDRSEGFITTLTLTKGF